MSELDQFATGFCVFQKANGQPPSNAEIRTQALTIMVLSRLAAQEGTAPVDESVINQAVTSVEPALSELSEEDKEAFLDEVRASVAADQKASGQAVADNGGQVPDDLQLAQAEVFAQWAEDAGVELDPRFGTWDKTSVQAVSGSLSVPADDSATDNDNPATRPCA